MSNPEDSVPVVSSDGTIKKLILFYKMGCKAVKKNKVSGIEAWKVKLYIIINSFKLLNAIQLQQGTIIKSMAGLIWIAKAQTNLNKVGVAYQFPVVPVPTIAVDDIPEEELERVLNSLDASKMTKN